MTGDFVYEDSMSIWVGSKREVSRVRRPIGMPPRQVLEHRHDP